MHLSVIPPNWRKSGIDFEARIVEFWEMRSCSWSLLQLSDAVQFRSGIPVDRKTEYGPTEYDSTIYDSTEYDPSKYAGFKYWDDLRKCVPNIS